MQLQADLTGLTLKVPRDAELSGMGAAYLAGLAQGVYTLDVLRQDRTAAVFKPQKDAAWRSWRLAAWQRAVQAALAYGLGQ